MTLSIGTMDPAGLTPDEQLALGLASQQAGDMAAARCAYEAALAQAPDDALALGLLGSLEVAQENLQRAEGLLQRAAQLDPTNTSTLFNLGLALFKRNRLNDALRYFERAVILRPGALGFLRQRAETMAMVVGPRETRAAWSELLTACDAALAKNPHDTHAQSCKGRALLGLQRDEEALEVFMRLRDQLPDDVDVLVRLGIALMALRRFAQARDVFAQSLELDPQCRLARLNMGNALLQLQDLSAAAAAYRELLAGTPDDSSVQMNLGVALREMGDLEQALACFDRTIVLRPSWKDALMTRAYCLLAMGHFERGWAEHEHRLRDPVVPWIHREFGGVPWDGFADLAGRTVLVWAEQGFGDALQFSRYASELGKFGARVVLEVHSSLVRLLRGLKHVDEVRPFSTEPADCDFHCALMSLPHLLGRRLRNIPSPLPYLAADAQDVARWAARMKGPQPNVGLAWTGNPAHLQDHLRSMPLDCLRASLPQGIRWWCAQKQVREADAGVLEQMSEIERPELGDFSDTAGLIANLDAVVTVDTSVAHLAAALGRPTFVLLPYASEWRWQTERNDSPWYRCVQLLRQPSPGDWKTPLREMAEKIGRLADARSRSRADSSYSAA